MSFASAQEECESLLLVEERLWLAENFSSEQALNVRKLETTVTAKVLV